MGGEALVQSPDYGVGIITLTCVAEGIFPFESHRTKNRIE